MNRKIHVAVMSKKHIFANFLQNVTQVTLNGFKTYKCLLIKNKSNHFRFKESATKKLWHFILWRAIPLNSTGMHSGQRIYVDWSLNGLKEQTVLLFGIVSKAVVRPVSICFYQFECIRDVNTNRIRFKVNCMFKKNFFLCNCLLNNCMQPLP